MKINIPYLSFSVQLIKSRQINVTINVTIMWHIPENHHKNTSVENPLLEHTTTAPDNRKAALEGSQAYSWAQIKVELDGSKIVWEITKEWYLFYFILTSYKSMATVADNDQTIVALEQHREGKITCKCHTLVPCDPSRGRVTPGTPGGVPIPIWGCYIFPHRNTPLDPG